MPASAPLQLAGSVLKVTPSLYLIFIVYEVIGEPPLNGADQVIVTPVLETTEVTGEVGVLGLAAALIENSDEAVL